MIPKLWEFHIDINAQVGDSSSQRVGEWGIWEVIMSVGSDSVAGEVSCNENVMLL